LSIRWECPAGDQEILLRKNTDTIMNTINRRRREGKGKWRELESSSFSSSSIVHDKIPFSLVPTEGEPIRNQNFTYGRYGGGATAQDS
jgi:hypothetical protein